MRVALLSFALWFLASLAFAQERFDVYFLAIGSGRYVNAAGLEGNHALPDIPGAPQSARIVSDLLIRGGATYGVTLVSDSTHALSRSDIYAAVRRVAIRLRDSGSVRPFFVFYFAGHGVADGTWLQHLLPGNIAYTDPDVPRLIDRTMQIHDLAVRTPTIVNTLKHLNAPFVVILDTCYEGTPIWQNWEPVVRTLDCPPGQIIDLCRSMRPDMLRLRRFDEQMKEMTRKNNEYFERLRKDNRFETTYPVLFSTEPGKTVSTVPNPLARDPRAVAIAPLARRIALSVEPVVAANRPMTLGAFLNELTAAETDLMTSPAITYSPRPSVDGLQLFGRSNPSGQYETLIGSATESVSCCAPFP